MAGKRKAEAVEHDKVVAGYSVELALAAFNDVRRRKVSKPKTQEEFWLSARFGALARLLTRMMATV